MFEPGKIPGLWAFLVYECRKHETENRETDRGLVEIKIQAE
jgi:hypothetical protein